jgi:hypothetical protein
MTHQLHSDACKCECDILAKKIRLIIANTNNGSLLFSMLKNALDGVCQCPPELLYKDSHYGWCGHDM